MKKDKATKLKSITTALEKSLQQPSASLTKQSLEWFRKYITKNLHRTTMQQALATGNAVRFPKPGNMYLYGYDPKMKDTLPYYDTFPLILCFNITENGWYGINVHYMPPRIRSLVFSVLFEHLNNDRIDTTTKMKTSWAKLKVLAHHAFIKHACKRYLADHITTPLIKVDPAYWEAVLFLPVAQFQKADQKKVWRDA